ncbi:hypothetical protein FJZ31_42835 [Candidatus Poribacteria bacterium]|nr:hypothetical protein [Candidatus Poribacteria bacterium]
MYSQHIYEKSANEAEIGENARRQDGKGLLAPFCSVHQSFSDVCWQHKSLAGRLGECFPSSLQPSIYNSSEKDRR